MLYPCYSSLLYLCYTHATVIYCIYVIPMLQLYIVFMLYPCYSYMLYLCYTHATVICWYCIESPITVSTCTTFLLCMPFNLTPVLFYSHVYGACIRIVCTNNRTTLSIVERYIYSMS